MQLLGVLLIFNVVVASAFLEFNSHQTFKLQKAGRHQKLVPNRKSGLLIPKGQSAIVPKMVIGSATVIAADNTVSTKTPGLWGKVLAFWGVMQVVGIIGNALRRLLPIALEPLKNGDMTHFHWFIYVSWSAFMAYYEGYKAFQKKFSPLVVKRSFTLADNPGLFNWLLAGPYSMGLFSATNKRMKVSWGITVGVAGLVGIVKKLPYPWRGIADAGVVAGLSWGTASIVVIFLKGLFGTLPDCDNELVKKNE